MPRRQTFEQKQQELERLRAEARKVIAELLNQMTRDQLRRYLKHKKLVLGRQWTQENKSGVQPQKEGNNERTNRT